MKKQLEANTSPLMTSSSGSISISKSFFSPVVVPPVQLSSNNHSSSCASTEEPRTNSCFVTAESKTYSAVTELDSDNDYDFITEDILAIEASESYNPKPMQPSRLSNFNMCPPASSNGMCSSSCNGSLSSKRTFKPPLLQSGSGGNDSFGVTSRKPAMLKPPLGRYDPPKDDASEFRGQYQHTREMYKIFNQVRL